MQKLGTVLQKLREANGYSQKQVAEHLAAREGKNVSFRAIQNMELGQTQVLGSRLLHLLQLYGIRDINTTFFVSDGDVQFTAEDYQRLDEYADYLLYRRRRISKGAGIMDEDGSLEFYDSSASGTIDLYDIPVAAGPGQYLDGSSATQIPRTSAVPAAADFATWVRGDSMEPIVYDGHIAWIHEQRVIEDGEIGVFSHNGEAKIKKLSLEADGAYLVSANSKYKPLLVLPDDELTAFGKVIGFCSPELLNM